MKPENELDENGGRPSEADDDTAPEAQDEERMNDGSMASRVHRWTPRPHT